MLTHAVIKTINPLTSDEHRRAARASLISTLHEEGYGEENIRRHLENEVAPGLSCSSQSSTYYGFVTGGITPAARHADHLVTEFDQNVGVHLSETVATDVEDCALRVLLELVRLVLEQWPHRIFTTGATASNVLGLAIARQAALAYPYIKKGAKPRSVAEVGIHTAMRDAGIEDVQILTTVPHSSLRKAASIVGLGRAAVVEVGRDEEPHLFDFERLEERLKQPKTASIVVVSCSEVNTGRFATDESSMHKLRELCDRYGAWLHVDAAFGLMARMLPPGDEYGAVSEGVQAIDLADSITGDAHKLLNVPYDCGFFFSRDVQSATEVFQNPNAAYLSSAMDNSISSPLNIGIENSRRFRALPVYATLAAYGRTGYVDMLQRQIQLARAVAGFILDTAGYELLPKSDLDRASILRGVYIVVLFRAKDERLNSSLTQRINATHRIYVSGTTWEGRPAARFAISNWQADVDRDLPIIENVLNGLL